MESFKSEVRAGMRIDWDVPADGVIPLPPNVRPVIVMGGSDYEMGYQYYQQLVRIFGPWILERVGTPKVTEEEKRTREVKEKYIRQWAPELIDQFRGMADAATAAGLRLSYAEVLTHFTRERPHGIEQIDSPMDCSGFAAWGKTTKDGKLICAGSTDHELNFEITLVAFPEKGNHFILSPFRPTEFGVSGGHPGMNNKGLAYVHHGATHWIQGKPKTEWTAGIDEGTAILHTLRFADNARDAKAMQLSYPSSDGYAGGLWADIRGEAFVIECRENPQVVRTAGDYEETDFLYATNNALARELGHCQSPPPQGNRYIPHGGWLGTGATISSVPRNLQIWNLLHHYPGEVDLEFVKMMWRLSGNLPSGKRLEDAEANYYKDQGQGWDQTIGSQSNAIVGIMIPDDGDEGVYYVSDGCPGRIAYPLAPHLHYYRIEPTFSFYQLKLASGPHGVAKAAKARAQYELYHANQELRKLTYRDAAYAPLDTVFNRAVVEWNIGQHHYQRLVISDPASREMIPGWGQAIRAFTRCQAFAQHVTNSLIPPPVRPEDLGVRPWQYWKELR